MKSFPRRWGFPLVCLFATAEARSADFVQARIDGLTNTGDVMAYVLPATALGLTAIFHDGEGTREFSKSAVITMAATVGLKYAIHSRRPNGKPHSFPSGHAAITFSSAEFMYQRYGWKYGVPAYVLASFVGYSRIRAHEHYFRDAAAGAALGLFTTHLLTQPYHGWLVQPALAHDYHGVRVSRTF